MIRVLTMAMAHMVLGVTVPFFPFVWVVQNQFRSLVSEARGCGVPRSTDRKVGVAETCEPTAAGRKHKETASMEHPDTSPAPSRPVMVMFV